MGTLCSKADEYEESVPLPKPKTITKKLRFDGKVAIITGGGGGLGRSYATFLASRGCKIVINDPGTNPYGEGGVSQKLADQVVNEIIAAGGEAIANYDGAEDGANIVKTAIDTFGTVDILIHSAGILRDNNIQDMTENDWDMVMKVHCKSVFTVTNAAWPIMEKKKFGRIIVSSSPCGIYGDATRSNYSTAKLGLWAFSKSMAIAGDAHNIKCNAIAPLAGTRMT